MEQGAAGRRQVVVALVAAAEARGLCCVHRPSVVAIEWMRAVAE